MPRRILLTGASGFVAGHLIPRLRAAFPAAKLSLNGHGGLDIADADAVQALVREFRPDACVHLAAVSTVQTARRDAAHAWRVNLHDSLALAAAVLAHAPDCTLLYASSSEVYGRTFRAGIALDETAAAAPMNIYAATKAAADLALGAMAGDGLRVIRARAFNHTGPGQSAEFVVPAFARQVARIEAGLQPPVMRVGALDPQRDFLDVRDVCAAYVACLERADAIETGAIFNLASSTPRRIGDMLEQLLALAGVTATLETGTALLRASEIPIAAGNAAAARAALGWRATIPWEQTLYDVLQDWRERVRREAE
jgi:nucleoside-diphosphate-sugar epimerase